ncbi:creatine transporter [Stachybotrys elegans]|uniref:Creatine transporter n=1 Tax=Stachybotrys elegans TaxID=80388 RepID=A0A8K0SF75_9HYPO|nr:creatine transporter [Stachybotrys elegans]
MAILDVIKKTFMGTATKDADGRDQWASRSAFVLAAMGGAVGLGNLLRYPSVVFNNSGAQWFIPYLIALFFLGIPILLLELSIGQAYRGGCVIAFNNINARAKGVGLGVVLTGYQVVVYYVPILSWVMTYFRWSFTNPLPWTDRVTDFYFQDVIRNEDPIPAVYSGASVVSYASYPSADLIGESAGWSAFTFFLIWLCISNGVGTTGRVVYLTMGLPVVMLFVLLGRGVSLPNAGRGINYYIGSWNTEKLADGQIWQEALGQIFFSIGVGFGYFTSFASYRSKHSNAVQDTLIISLCNSAYEVVAAFGVFGVIGYLGLSPEEDGPLGTFSTGFLTYPEAIAQMPASNLWAVLFFLTLMFLGLSSAFALLDSLVTLVCDTDWGKKIPRVAVTAILCVISFLLSLIFCTEFGYYLLDAVDTYVNYLSLFFVVWAEIVCATTLYRAKDVMNQVGRPAVLIYNGGYLLGQICGLGLAHGYSAPAGAGLGFGLYVLGLVTSLLLARTPDARTPRFFQKLPFMDRLYWLMFYSGTQLTRDLNYTVGEGGNWKIPFFWAHILKYISAPILAIVYSFSYPRFNSNRGDPLHIFAFTVCHLTVLMIIIGFIIPKWFDVFVPPARRNDGKAQYIPGVDATPMQDADQDTEQDASATEQDMALPPSKEAGRE